jgi:hypothetical protein
VTFLNLVFLVAGAVGVLGGAWPLVMGRNYPGVLGRGFTRGDNLRLKRAPAIYFRAMGATIASAGLFLLYVGILMGLPARPPLAGLVIAAILGGSVVISFLGSFAWLFVLAYRYKLFRWNAP